MNWEETALKKKVLITWRNVFELVEADDDEESRATAVMPIPLDLKKIFNKYLEDHNSHDDPEKDPKPLEIDATELSREALKLLMISNKVKEVDRKAIAKFLYPDPGLAACESLVDVYLTLCAHTLVHGNRPTIEVEVCGVWEPTFCTPEYVNSRLFGAFIRVEVVLDLAGTDSCKEFGIRAAQLQDVFGNKKMITLTQAIEKISASSNFRLLNFTEDQYLGWLQRCEQAKQTGIRTMIGSFRGQGLFYNGYNNEFYVALVSDEPIQVIVDSLIERSDGDDYKKAEAQSTIVRAFDLGRKLWFYAPLEAIKPFNWSTNCLDRLVLPDRTKHILSKVFSTKTEHIFGDVIAGKGGGLVIEAHGPTGTGKTLTAELFAQNMKRPLYALTMAELSMAPDSIEKKLGVIFARAIRWNAVILFDEADILLGKRGPEEMLRSAIVGVFLRTMDYFRGVIFMTTNRHSSLDDAIDSRISIRLEYPPLVPEVRAEIWKVILKESNLTVTGDHNRLYNLDANGRIIRNSVRVMLCLYGNTCTVDDVVEFMEERIGSKKGVNQELVTV